MACPEYVPGFGDSSGHEFAGVAASVWACVQGRAFPGSGAVREVPAPGRATGPEENPAWSSRGRPPAGSFTKRLAEEWLREVLHEASRGALAAQAQTGVRFADAAAE
jgi:hypothetical protein